MKVTKRVMTYEGYNQCKDSGKLKNGRIYESYKKSKKILKNKTVKNNGKLQNDYGHIETKKYKDIGKL